MDKKPTFSQKLKEKAAAKKEIKTPTGTKKEVVAEIIPEQVQKVETADVPKEIVTEVKPEVQPTAEVKQDEIVAPVVAEKPKEVLEVKEEIKEPVKEQTTDGVEIFKGVKIDPRKTYHFKLKHSENPRTLLPRESKVWCEETKSTRLIKLCSIEESPYADEQHEDSVLDRTPICFTDGDLYVRGTEGNRVKFILAFDGWDKKEKVLDQNYFVRDKYELVDQGKITAADVKLDEAKIDAGILVREASEEDLSDFLRSRFLEDVHSKTPQEVKRLGYKHASDDPYIFLNDFTDPMFKIQANIQKLFVAGQLSDNGGVVRWTDTQGIIMHLPEGKRADEALAKWIVGGSDESKDFAKVMKQKL